MTIPGGQAGGKQTRFKISGMDCASCAAKIDTAVRRLDGVADVSVSVTGASMTVSHGGPLDDGKVLKQVARLGYGIAKAQAGKNERPSAGTKAHDHAGHDHEGHDHTGHDHEVHDHQGHDHEGHDHRGGERVASGAVGSSHLHIDAGPGQPLWRSRRAMLTLACAAALLAAYGIGHLFPVAERWVFLAALLVGLVPIARRALMAALAGTPFSIETLMTIAATGAVMINATEEAAAVVVLFLIGELLEGVAAGRARASIQGLADLVPKTALVERAGVTSEVAADQLAVGDIILVRPGDRIPADGEIVEGSGDIDEAPVTGESTPKRKGVGEAVFAGTINIDGVLKARVTATAADNTIARVVRLVEEAQEAKAPTERFIDRFSRTYTPGVLVVGALVALLPPLVAGSDWNEWIYKGLAILLIGCPCALVISTPAAIAAGLAAGARRGLLMKGGAVLEGFRRITAVAFDKTGTLTLGKPDVTDVLAFGGDERSVLALAAALEQGSSHPLAVAILDKARVDKVPVPPVLSAKAISGKGVEGSVGGVKVFLGSGQAAAERAPLDEAQSLAIESLNGQGKTVSVLVADGAIAGLIAMRDEPRPDAAAGIAALKGEGIRAVMLTGDNRRAATAIAASLGIEARAELMPQDKQRIVGELQRGGLTVAKVGDGINDAPALAAADIGIAMGSGTDVALETADAAILHSRVTDVARMVRLSRAVMANIGQNITVALGLKAVFLVTTIAGVTGLWPAILADTGATVLVTANAMRLLRWRG
ncbi:cadmium-translocating P-type ATPase [Mesorhizobium sp. M00.F.Ca.ET.186.01.1.1]|nr:cadmium-translocating P-type ATPase [bacterium M00.F.Ca.ET.205.01.1.1]TGU55249.1 cadmium-translocating P-type ATPase [bacterium M00.F.Ca.ET.152.01.1.1]TGV40617.1 cadmium-translocating P-type ATPase [Mesorhizobium sp. M00.F.Ca.ET.186.01.1.1]TGZ45457.1 cadmium-translocating P-type ATPase [bacterium M00.F.Ca.ET.162.01.1.1]TIW61310.1 MAG: cadmium-translocating P-type ATPase [Mesorhizobium sp.]